MPSGNNFSFTTNVGSIAPSGVGLSTGQQFADSYVRSRSPEVGEMRHLNGFIKMWTGTDWVDVSPNQMKPEELGPLDVNSEPVDALAMAIYRTYEATPGSNLPAARAAAADVIQSLLDLGFTLEPTKGSKTSGKMEEDYDFSDICAPCAQATDEYAAAMDDPSSVVRPDPDRFCLFHRGYVMGQLG